MQKKVNKSFWNNKREIIVSLLVFGLFLFIINYWFWPTPDEYFYVSVSRSLVSSFTHTFCISCINTEHTYLVSSIVAFYQWVIHIDRFDLIYARVPIIAFSLGTVYLLWLISERVVEKKNERIWFLLLLLLIPGYFTHSVRFLLDVPLTFGFALLTYLLIVNARLVWISLSLALILLIKDYGFFLAIPLVFVTIILDTFAKNGNTVKKIGTSLLKFTLALVPSFMIIAVLLGSNTIPYPRLLETDMIQYTGWLYPTFTKGVLYFEYMWDKLMKIIPFIHDSPSTVLSHSNIYKIGSIQYGQPIPSAIFDSPLAPEQSGGFLHRLWLIYKYNFSDQDVIIFALPLFFTGLYTKIQEVFRRGILFTKKRADIIMLLIVLLFIYVNVHEAFNIHGFRVTVPITIAIVYFSYFGLRKVLNEKNVPYRVIFMALFGLFLFLYFKFVSQIGTYGSTLAQEGIIGTLLHYKVGIFMIIYSAGFILLWYYGRLRSSKRQLILIVYLLFLFSLKFIPFYLDSKASNNYFGFDYGLPNASPILEKLRGQSKTVASNLNRYVLMYYSGELELTNAGSYPSMRIFEKDYPSYFDRINNTNEPVKKQFTSSASDIYVLYVNNEFKKVPTSAFYKSLIEDSKNIVLIDESRKNDRIQWQMFHINSLSQI